MRRLDQQILALKEALRKDQDLYASLDKMETADIAAFMAQEDEQDALAMVSCLNKQKKLGDVLVELPIDRLEWVLNQMDLIELKTLFNSSTVDDLVYLQDYIAPEIRESVIAGSSKKHQIKKYLQYGEDEVGRLMQTHAFSLPSTMTVSESIEKLRERSLEEFIYYIYCVDHQQKLNGLVTMRQIATAPADKTLEQLMKRNVVSVQPKLSNKEVAKIAAHYNFLALPIVDDKQQLLGLVTMDDIIDIIQDQNTANIYATAGLHPEEKIYTSPWTSIKSRTPWMCLNLALAILASTVISLFEQTMSHLIILASLKNIVASMGGNTAIQTLTVTTRGIATGDFRFTPFTQSLFKELTVGLVMGLFMGAGAGAITYLWKGNLLVSLIIFISMLLNSLLAVFVGSMTPILLSKFKRDPAIGSGVIVTMITDIFGFVTFLGIARLGLYLTGLQL